MSIKIKDLISLLRPGWVAMDSDGFWFWFEEKPVLKEKFWVKIKNPDDTEEDLYYYFDDMNEKPEDIPYEEVEIDYIWSSKGRKEIISCDLKSDAFMHIEPVEDWTKSLRKVDAHRDV